MSFNKRNIEFLYEIGSLRHIPRAWQQTVGAHVANDLEHTMRVVWMALLLGRAEGGVNEEKLMKMALVHDIAETRTGDLGYVQKVYAETNEERAVQDIFEGTSLPDFVTDILAEYELRVSLEAKVVKDADNLDIDLEMRELAQQGVQLPKQWPMFRQQMRDNELFTQAARSLWDTLDEVNVADWHLAANHWVKKTERS